MSVPPFWNSLESLRALYQEKEPGYDETPWRSLTTIYPIYEMELETLDFIYAMIRLLKPALVLESGAGYGASSSFIGYALKENNYGKLISYESSPEWLALAQERVSPLGLPIELRQGTIAGYSGEQPRMVIIDSEPSYRREEIARWKNQKDVILVIHDANRNYDVPRGIIFDSYRGLYIGTGE